MPTPPEPWRKDNRRGTYAALDSEKELTRLMIHDRLITATMGGVLSEQTDPTVFRRLLDVACGPGGWVIEIAQTYPEMSLVGIDINKEMIKYARAQAEAHQVKDRVEFHVMDALLTLEFPRASFDLANMRLGFSFLRTWDWPKMLSELLRVTRPGGVVRVTETESIIQNNSPALMRLFEMLQCALYRAGHLFTQESMGLINQLPRLLDQYGCEQVQTKSHIMEYRAGTEEGEAFYEDWMLGFQTVRPFVQKWGCSSEDYGVIYQQALDEMRQPDFFATGNLLTAWGSKPKPK
ncbi:MAG TPA: methyltransferase domain-containing protein [Ktedonobacteraceae bacterium]|jgi:ubiquinone/menaquinone biosynthesis C-methylase UbiE|nr:methyltransferase domain-containing protein [Ktedonobacteraceae bacterium]